MQMKAQRKNSYQFAAKPIVVEMVISFLKTKVMAGNVFSDENVLNYCLLKALERALLVQARTSRLNEKHLIRLPA